MFKQVFCDLVASKDGKVTSGRRAVGEPQFVKVFFTNPDITVAMNWPPNSEAKHPRLSPGAYALGLKTLFESSYNLPLEYTSYGKPELKHF